MALGGTGLLIQEVEPVGTILVHARDGFNKPSRLATLWKVHHRWLSGSRFESNCYKH